MEDEEELADKARAFSVDPANYYRANFFQQRLFHAVKDLKPKTLTVVLALKPNRVGGSFGLIELWSALMFGTRNPLLSQPPFGGSWPFLKTARLVSTSENLADVGALQTAIRNIFPRGRYSQNRGVGKGYNSAGKTDTGWTWDAYSYGQDALSAAGSTLGLVLMSEPPPKDLYNECLTRLSGNGLMIVECVQLDLAPWLNDMAEAAGGRVVTLPMYREENGKKVACNDPVPRALRFGSLKLNGRDVGEIRIVRGDVEDACEEHSNGHMAHSSVEAMVAGWTSEEREARAKGLPLKLSGRIYPEWGDDHEIKEIPEWHRKQWDAGDVRIIGMLDPHDAKPWAKAYFAVYPNDDVIAFSEWPNFDFAACKRSPVSDVEEYRFLILDMEANFGREPDVRVIDKLFGNTPGKGTRLTLRKMLARPCRECLRHVGLTEYEDLDERSQAYLNAERACAHVLRYQEGVTYKGSIAAGHQIVRGYLGHPEQGRRPKLYALKQFTPNFCHGMRNYAYMVQNNPARGVSDKPELVHKDFPDLIRNLMLKGLHIWPKDVAPPPAPLPAGVWKPTAKPLILPANDSITPRDRRPRRK